MRRAFGFSSRIASCTVENGTVCVRAGKNIVIFDRISATPRMRSSSIDPLVYDTAQKNAVNAPMMAAIKVRFRVTTVDISSGVALDAYTF